MGLSGTLAAQTLRRKCTKLAEGRHCLKRGHILHLYNWILNKIPVGRISGTHNCAENIHNVSAMMQIDAKKTDTICRHFQINYQHIGCSNQTT